LILIAPETEKISLKLHLKLKKNFKLLNSSFFCTKTFSSKIKTIHTLKKKKILCLDIENVKNIKNIKKEYLIIKPEYGAGSENIMILKNNENIKNNKGSFLQKFSEGKKGSFSMLCFKGKAKVLTCNEQIVSIKDNNIEQIGLYVGGFENHRPEIQNLANQICSAFKGLFGFIGVDIVMHNKKLKVIEINSRFTSSYVGIQSSYGQDVLHEITNFYVKNILKNNIKTNLKTINKIYF
jgi:predicted ATP-grasp superfamily ATP-dependent carboligase